MPTAPSLLITLTLLVSLCLSLHSIFPTLYLFLVSVFRFRHFRFLSLCATLPCVFLFIPPHNSFFACLLRSAYVTVTVTVTVTVSLCLCLSASVSFSVAALYPS